MTGRLRATVLLVAAMASLPPAASAQIRASERGSVAQTVDGTVITVDYARPQVRGRTLWGDIVPWGKVWTGANWATTIEANRDITLNGHPLAAGKYSVWMQVKQEGGWTAIFHPETRLYHIQPPEPSADQLRFDVSPAPSPHAELLTWSFTDVRPTGTKLQMAWGDTAVTFDVGVSPSRKLTVEADVAQAYVGSYRLTQSAPFQAGEVAFDITYEGDKLVGRWENAPNPLLETIWLVPLGAGMFMPAETENGELVDMQSDMVFEFAPVEGRATGFEIRILDDLLVGTGVRG